MALPVQLAWLTGSLELNRLFAEKLSALYPDLSLVIVSEFPVGPFRWVAFHPKRRFKENLRSIREALRHDNVQTSSALLTPRVPYWRLRAIALLTSGTRLAVYDQNLVARVWPLQIARLVKAWVAWHGRPASPARRWMRRLAKPEEALVPLLAKVALVTMRLRTRSAPRQSPSAIRLPSGIAVIVPSRDGLALLRECLPAIAAQNPAQIIVVDNGSSDDTAHALSEFEIVEASRPLSFARAINMGLARVKYERVLLLNNDMLVQPGFLAALDRAFGAVPNLFCATAQIQFPAGARREETGKAVLREPAAETDFPVRCDLPLLGEDGTWVLYGSGGCSLFDTAKLLALGGLNEALAPAYVEDLDIGFRAWQRGWPSVFRAAARVEHRHRSTTGRYWTPDQLENMVQVNYLRFLASTIANDGLFFKMWRQAIRRLHLNGARTALRHAISIPLVHRAPAAQVPGEDAIFALTNGDVAVFPGRAASAKPVVLIAAPYLPFPLSHGGAVRIYNLMREGAREFDWVLIAFQELWEPPPQELLDWSVEVTLVRRAGSHYRVSTVRPDTVEEFDSLTFRAALRQTVRKWKPRIAQLEWTQMAQYAPDCAPAKTVLAEHDITFDLYDQLVVQVPGDAEITTQRERWRAFETAAWGNVDAVVVMSEKDRKQISSPRAFVIPNGVDTERYQPSRDHVEPNSLLFIGSWSHYPNRSGMEWFLQHVWPLLEDLKPRLHIIAGSQRPELHLPRVTVDGFVSDVRPAYRRAAVVIAPLLISAGTNIKILEAMAMGKAIVSTTAGVNGLDVEGVTIANTPQQFAAAIRACCDPSLNGLARDCAERHYSWHRIAELQSELYRNLLNSP